MTLQVPITLKGTNINAAVNIPFSAAIPNPPLGSWLTQAEVAAINYPDIEIVDQSGSANFAAIGTRLEYYFRIDVEHEAELQTSVVRAYILGDVLDKDKYTLSKISGNLYKLLIPKLRVVPGVENPKFQIIIHNNTKSFVISPSINALPLSISNVVTDDVGGLITKEVPIMISNDNAVHLFRIQSNTNLMTWQTGPKPGMSNSLFDQYIIGLLISPTGYIYRVSVKYRTLLTYGRSIELLALWNDASGNLTTSIYLLSVEPNGYYDLAVPATWTVPQFTSATGVIYDSKGNGTPDKIHYYTSTENISYPSEIKVILHQWADSDVRSNSIVIPFNGVNSLWSTIKTNGTGPLKDVIVFRYETYNSADVLLETKTLSWGDCIELCSDNGEIHLPITDNTVVKVKLFKKFATTTESVVTLYLEYDIYGTSTVGGTGFNFEYKLHPALGNDLTPVMYTVQSETIPVIFNSLVVTPSNDLVYDPVTGPHITITVRPPTIQELLDDIH